MVIISQIQSVVTGHLRKSTSATVYHIPLVLKDEEYSQLLPSNTKAIEFQARQSRLVRYAFEAGKVATPTEPYSTLKAGGFYYKENLLFNGVTIYFATVLAGTDLELVVWS